MRKIVSVILFLLLSICLFTLAFDIRPASAQADTVYINSDGSVSPSSAPISSSDSVTYTFTGDISNPTYYGLVVERSNIIIDGNGYTVQGNYSGNGISLTDVINVTIKNISVQNFQNGIYLSGSDNNTISGNSVTSNVDDGIYLDNSSNSNTVIGNTATANTYGIYIDGSSNTTLSLNTATNNSYGILLYSSSNNTVSGNTATNNSYGLLLYISSNYNTVSGNSVTANYDSILLYISSNNNIVSGNSVTANYEGIVLYSSSNNNIVSGNNATANVHDGIVLESSSYNNVSGNNFAANYEGIVLYSSSNNNIVSGNNATANKSVGIYLEYSSNNNTVIGNNATANDQYGIYLNSSSSNIIYHNHFTSNDLQVGSVNSTNIWDDGYPSGGNYWSDYNGTDLYSGPYQNVTGSDGIGDTPYVIDANNVDHYPLMLPVVLIHDVAVTDVESLDVPWDSGGIPKTVIGLGYSLTVNVTAADLGSYTETFNITVYANTTYVTSQNVTLSSGASATLAFTWNTTGFAYGNYTVSAYAWPVPGETNMANNNFTGGNVIVTIPGDINGDFKVVLPNLVLLAQAYGSKPADSNWNPNADIDGNGQVGLSDLVILAQDYGQHYP